MADEQLTSPSLGLAANARRLRNAGRVPAKDRKTMRRAPLHKTRPELFRWIHKQSTLSFA
jgi:hypothetical protein